MLKWLREKFRRWFKRKKIETIFIKREPTLTLIELLYLDNPLYALMKSREATLKDQHIIEQLCSPWGRFYP